MGKFIDVEATAEKIYKKYGMHPAYYADVHTKQGKEAGTDCIVLEMIYDEKRMVYADDKKPEVVRCKDCKWYGGTYVGCDRLDGLVGAVEDSYCSRGERKEKTDD